MPSKFKVQSKFIQIDKIFDFIEQKFIQLRMDLIEVNEFKIPNYKKAVENYIKNTYNYEISNKIDRMLVNMTMATDTEIYLSQVQLLIRSALFYDIMIQVILKEFAHCDIIIPNDMRKYGIGLTSRVKQGIKYICIFDANKDKKYLDKFDEIIKIEKRIMNGNIRRNTSINTIR